MREYILAEKNNDDYDAVDIFTQLDDALDGMEYGDVRRDTYQIWEYPSGVISKVIAETFIAMDDEDYSTANPKKWMPKIIHIEHDKDKVLSGYKHLRANDDPLL